MSASAAIPYETVEIDINSFETTAARLVCSIKPRWALKKLIFKKLTTDDRIICYTISLKNNEDEHSGVVLKMYPINSDVYTDRQEQYRLLVHFIQHKIAPSILLRFTNGYLFSNIQGKTLDIKEQQIHELIARKMAEFHSLPFRFHGPQLADKLRHFIGLFTDKNQALHDRMAEIQKEKEKSANNNKSLFTSLKSAIGLNPAPTFPLAFAQLQAQLKDISWTELSSDIDSMQSIFDKNWSSFDLPIVLCLNNMRLNNFLFDQKNRSLSIIDFDHCSHNYYLIDIVSYFLELASDDYERKYPERHVQKQFFVVYLKNSTLNLSSIVYDHRQPADHELEQLCDLCGLLIAPVHLYWALWTFLQVLLVKPTATFDYVNYGRIRLAQYFRHRNKFFLPLNHLQKDRPKF